ncbi:hypothetical protein V3481_012704 [Fusarium oxysporum f. sp. vasinfectum]
MLTMVSPSPHPLSFSMSRPWEPNRCPEYYRSRTYNDKFTLVPIRQEFPDLQLQTQPPHDLNNKPPVTGPPLGTAALTATSPQYVYSLNSSKRRRVSMETEVESQRVCQAPRLCYSPDRPPPRQTSPNLPMQQENWEAPTRIGPFQAKISEPANSRPIMPSLRRPHSVRLKLPFSSGPVPSDGNPQSRQPIRHSQITISESGVSLYCECSYGHPYHHPAQYQSLCTGVAHSFDHTPFTQGACNSHYQAFAPYGHIGPASVSGDNKQQMRKRTLSRTQDKLRKWFAANLQHPYPTEDEKQDLMRQTGLRMGKLIQLSYAGGQESSAYRGTIFPSTTRTAEAFAGSKSIGLGAPPRTWYNRPPPVLTSNRTIIRPPLLLEPPPPSPRVPALTKVQHVQELCLAPIRNQPLSRTPIILPRVPEL